MQHWPILTFTGSSTYVSSYVCSCYWIYWLYRTKGSFQVLDLGQNRKRSFWAHFACPCSFWETGLTLSHNEDKNILSSITFAKSFWSRACLALIVQSKMFFCKRYFWTVFTMKVNGLQMERLLLLAKTKTVIKSLIEWLKLQLQLIQKLKVLK